MNIGIKFIALVLSISIIGLIYNGLFNPHQNLTYLTTNFIIYFLIISSLIHLCIKDVNNNKFNPMFDLLLLFFLIIILFEKWDKYRYHFNLINQNKIKKIYIINQI